jgi:hypothetical protein
MTSESIGGSLGPLSSTLSIFNSRLDGSPGDILIVRGSVVTPAARMKSGFAGRGVV